MAIENLDKLISKLEKLDNVNQAMEQACILVENEAKIKCPVDNGLLRNSITHYIEDNPNELVGVVGTNVEYAPYVEFGTGIYSSLGNGRYGNTKMLKVNGTLPQANTLSLTYNLPQRKTAGKQKRCLKSKLKKE